MGKFVGYRSFGGLLLGALTLLVACGGGTDAPPPAGGAAPGSASVFVFIGDAPPAGSTILKFEITLSSARLCPDVSGGTCSGTPIVNLLTAPVEIELTQLELESAFLSLVSVQEGTYGGVELTFASPELDILLADGTFQELEAPGDFLLDPAMVTATFPMAVTVTADTNFGFLVDFNIFDSIITDPDGSNNITTISPMVSLVELPAIAGAEIEELEDVTGTISALNATCPTGTFTLTESMTGLPITNINFDATTEFDPDAEESPTDPFTCEDLVDGLLVEVDLELRMGADLMTAQWFAEEIELVEDDPDEDELEGLVFQVNSDTEFVLFVQEAEVVPPTVVPIGSFVTVTLTTGLNGGATEFRIDDDDLPVNPLDFNAGDDLLAGQKVEVDVLAGTLDTMGTQCGETDGCVATAEKIKLKKSTITANVAALNDPNFTIDDLPSIFGNAGMLRQISSDCLSCFIGSIEVRTFTPQTEFRDTLTNFSDLNVADTVTVRGLLIKSDFSGPDPGTGTPALLATRVRRRD